MQLIELITAKDHVAAVTDVALAEDAANVQVLDPGAQGMALIRIAVPDDHVQALVDALQSKYLSDQHSRLSVSALSTYLPKASDAERKEESAAKETREALYASVERGSVLDGTYMALVLLSTIVALIGLIQNNTAVVIAAMVIAPLLGPNLALALGATLGDSHLMLRSIKAGSVGIAVATATSISVGWLWSGELTSVELISRTQPGYDAMLLALASGAAAALSLTTRVPSALVGVMVAVALLPPTVTAGLFFGAGQYWASLGALILLAINFAALNLATQLVFMIQGISPRTWYERRRARKELLITLSVWIAVLLVLLFAVYQFSF